MEREYRQVLENIRLTKEEAIILHKSEMIIQEAIYDVLDYKDHCGQIDNDLIEKLNICMDGMKECYPRINVHVTSGLE